MQLFTALDSSRSMRDASLASIKPMVATGENR